MDNKDPNWLSGQEAFDDVVKWLLGPHYYEQFDWIQNGTANAIALDEIKKKYPIKLLKVVSRIWSFFHRK